MSEVINWFNRDRDKYVIFGASVYDANFETWVQDDYGNTLEKFLDGLSESWDLHFNKDNMPRNGGHFVYFYPQLPYTDEIAQKEAQWMIEEWDGEDSEAFLLDLVGKIAKHWHKNWSCGFGHLTSEAFYEINWRKHNV